MLVAASISLGLTDPPRNVILSKSRRLDRSREIISPIAMRRKDDEVKPFSLPLNYVSADR